MRVSLARGLYINPSLLMLDEPTNHLDINAVVWLTNYLSMWKKTLIIISYDTHFINNICNKIVYLEQKTLHYYDGNYESFQKKYKDHIKESNKKWNHIQAELRNMKKKSMSKEITTKFIADNAHLEPPKQYIINIMFDSSYTLTKITPIMLADKLTFRYDSDKILFDSISLEITLKSKIMIVGSNGVGKTTLFRVLSQSLLPLSGTVWIDSKVRMEIYDQHISNSVPLDDIPTKVIESMDSSINSRKILGAIGLPGNVHTIPIRCLSGGQKARVALAKIIVKKPNLIFLDEPTNHLDVESIDALISAINQFEGSVCMITHNIDLIRKTNATIYELTNNSLRQVDFDEYCGRVIDRM